MSLARICSGITLGVSLILAIQADMVCAQQRPGVRPNVNPPENCYVDAPVETENSFSFLGAQIQALSLAHDGEWANKKMLDTKGGAPPGEVDQTIMGLRKERIDNMCAAFVVSYYVNSRTPSIASTAKLFKDSFDELGKMSDQMLGINLQWFARKPIGLPPQRQLSILMTRRQEILHKMGDSLNQSLQLFIDESRISEEGKPDHLVLNKDEINELLHCLDTFFPALKNIDKLERPGEFLKQAASIQTFLTSSYKPANVP
jgi:hypothetical protein